MFAPLIVLLHRAGRAAGAAFVSNTTATYNSTHLSVDAWHAEALTNVSWSLRDRRSADLRDRIIVYWHEGATGLLRFGAVNEANPSSTSSTWSSSSSPATNAYTAFLDEMGAGSDICNLTAYTMDPLHPFDNEVISEGATVWLESDGYSTWWYTSTLAQEVNSTATGADQGNASVLLGEPGLYIVCFVPGDEECIALDCVKVRVYQPPYDIFQVSSTNIGALVTVRFNIVSFDSSLGDWGWILGGVNPSFGVDDANALASGEVYDQFQEGCWFYFGQAVTLGHPFLCSRDPDTELASLQASTSTKVYQYGSFHINSAASGNLSIWYAMDEDYDFAMVHNYYTCGIDIRGPVLSMTNTTSDVVVVGNLESGEGCAFGDGLPLRIRTTEITFSYVDVSASIYFWGQMDIMTPNHTSLSLRLPVKGAHEIVVELESGGTLATLSMEATPGDPYAPASIVQSTYPTSIAVHSTVNLTFLSRDFYNNDVTTGYGNSAFEAWTIQPASYETNEAVYDIGNGSYLAHLQAFNETGATLVFIQRDGLNIPGSPFEIYVFGPNQCVIESLDIRVDGCGSSLHRNVVHTWKEGTDCHGGLALPGYSKVRCSYIPAGSALGRTMVGVSIFAAIYSSFYLQWITRHRKSVVVKLSQPFVCKLFCTGCIILNLTVPLQLGKPSDLVCMARPIMVHTTLTFASSCLYMKTYRVHRLFNNTGLTRMAVSDRSLVAWVLRLVAVDAVILTLWMLVDRPRTIMVREVLGYAEVLSPICAPGAAYFSTFLWVYKGGLNAFGVVMAAKTWNCADGIGEAGLSLYPYTSIISSFTVPFTKYCSTYKSDMERTNVRRQQSQSICLSVYNTMLLGLVNLALHLLVSDNTVATLCAQSFAAIGGTMFTVSVVFGPKVYKLYYNGDIPASSGDRQNRSSYSVGKESAPNFRRRSSSIQPAFSISQHTSKGIRSWRGSPEFMTRRDSRGSPKLQNVDEWSTTDGRSPARPIYLPPVLAHPEAPVLAHPEASDRSRLHTIHTP